MSDAEKPIQPLLQANQADYDKELKALGDAAQSAASVGTFAMHIMNIMRDVPVGHENDGEIGAEELWIDAEVLFGHAGRFLASAMKFRRCLAGAVRFGLISITDSADAGAKAESEKQSEESIHE